MATTPRQQIASPQSFTSDPLEQVFAKQFSDPNSVVGALSLVNMQTAGAARDRGQAQYLDNLHMTNQLAAQLAREDMNSDLLKESLQQGQLTTSLLVSIQVICLSSNAYSLETLAT